MVLTTAASISRDGVEKFAWSALKKFHHVPTVTAKLMEKHKVADKHRPNVVKQATQIRQCLIQAREYKDAAEVTSLATRPLLLYYSAMSLALAQILYKGDGGVSLDAARGEHAHHGLTFAVSSVAKGSPELASASSLVAKPMSKDGKRRGTFELWHKTAREDPVVGEQVHRTLAGTTTIRAEVFLASADKRLGEIPDRGMTFLDCLLGTPGMVEWLAHQGVNSDIVRGSFSVSIDLEGEQTASLIVHPARPDRVDEVASAVMLNPGLVDKITFGNFPGGFSLRVPEFTVSRFSLPNCAMWTNKEIRFFPCDTTLNEFGYIYIGLYMLGNYARYYPDRWMLDVEHGSVLALGTEDFMTISEWRMALLTLSELSETYFVCLA